MMKKVVKKKVSKAKEKEKEKEKAYDLGAVVDVLYIGDIQDVALDKLGRTLTNSEMDSVVEDYKSCIEWYETVSTAIDILIEK